MKSQFSTLWFFSRGSGLLGWADLENKCLSHEVKEIQSEARVVLQNDLALSLDERGS